MTLSGAFAGSQATAFGSYRTGLWMPWSDVDLVLALPAGRSRDDFLRSVEAHLVVV